MRLLIYQWNSYFQYDLYEICKEMKIDFQIFEWKFESKNRDDSFENWFDKEVCVQNYDALLSVNYYPVLSQVCQKSGLKYIAWCYDNPLNVERIEETLGNEVNSVFLFDRIQYEGYAKKGFKTVYHLPLGVNRTRLSALKVTPNEYETYKADVSFIGNLYGSALQELMAPLNEYTRGYLNSLMDMQSQIYGYFLLDQGISDELIKDINDQYKHINPNTKLILNKQALLFAMSSEITRKDRLILLNLCGRRYVTKFYSYDDSDIIQNVIKCGSLDYVTQMPQMFASSKINLNPSLRIIQSGIPQRALDIMGAGGFLLSNYQEELAEYYVSGDEVVLYESIEDAVEKIAYYLLHEDKRVEIAKKGREKTLEEHSMQQCIADILTISGV